MTGKQTSCNTKTFQVFSSKQQILTHFQGLCTRDKSWILAVTEKCLRNGSGTAICNQNFRFSPASVSGKGDHATGNTHITSHTTAFIGCCCMSVDAVLGKTTLLVANFGIFKYLQVFISVLVCQLVKFVVIFCEQTQLVGPGLTAA